MKRNIVVIGSGLGGLVSSYLLTREGDHVTILERDKRPGGCLQSFCRDGINFDTGFHFVGGMSEGGPLYRFFRDLDLFGLPWQELDGQEIWCGDKCYSIPTGKERWLRYMTSEFPHQRANLEQFVKTCEEIAHCPFDKTLPYWEINAWDWLCRTIDDPRLRDVLSGSSLIIQLDRETLPLFAFGEIVYSYIFSSHRLAGGGKPLIDHFLNYILKTGEIHCSSTVTQILEQDGHVSGVRTEDGTFYPADIVLSSIHPALTMGLLADDSSIRKVYRRRLTKLNNSMGCFTANLKLKRGMVEMKDRPVYVHRDGSDFWKFDTDTINHELIHFYPGQDALDFITPLSWNRVSRWQNTSVGRRGSDYEEYKASLLNQCIELAENAIPGLSQAIDVSWSSTPLTWRDYFGSLNGTAYGVCKDFKSPEGTILLPRTPLHGLYLTGQSSILHGIMGTTISGFISVESLKQQ